MATAKDRLKNVLSNAADVATKVAEMKAEEEIERFAKKHDLDITAKDIFGEKKKED